MEAARVVELHAGGYGTGYLVAPRLVLTAKHLVTNRDRIMIRTLDSVDHCGGTVAWMSPDLDAALVKIDALKGADLAPVRWGRLISTNPGVPWEFAGFPRVQKLAGGRRALERLRGQLDPMAGAPHGIQLQLVDPVPPGPAPWRGLSGAAVTCYELVTALVTDSMESYEHRRLIALPVERLVADPVFRDVVSTATGADPLLEPVELMPIITTRFQARPRSVPALSPASLLRPDAETIAFHGRAEQLQQLTEWCDGGGLGVWLLTGPGGAGKTRLARQLAHTLEGKGWITGTLAPDADLSLVRDHLTRLRLPLLLVVDYAETRPEQIKELLSCVRSHSNPNSLRILLLARALSDWWQQLISEVPRDLRNVLSAATIRGMPPLSPKEREAIFTNAARGLASRAPGEHPGKVRLPDLSTEQFGSPLRIAMEALTAVLEASRHETSTSVEQVILDHEQPYWAAAAVAHGLSLEPEDQRVAVAAAALCGAVDQAEAIAVLRHLDGLTDNTDDGHRRRQRTARWLHGLYPAPAAESSATAGAYWGPLQPDLLAEHLVAAVIEANTSLLPKLLAEPSEAQAQQALRVLSRAAVHRPDVSSQVGDLVGQRLDLARQAIKVIPQVADWLLLASAVAEAIIRIPLQHESVSLLWDIARETPRRSHHLAGVRRQVFTALIAIHTNAGPPQTVSDAQSLAAALGNFADEMAIYGRKDIAVWALQLAAHSYQGLAEHDGDQFLPALAEVLKRLASRLAEAGRRDDATAAIDRALDIAEQLATKDPDLYEPLLASTLSSFAVLFPKSRAREALAAMKRAVNIQEKRATNAEGLAAVSSALVNLSAMYVAAQQYDEALAVAERAVAIDERLAERNPDVHRLSLATSLYTLTALLTQDHQFERALQRADQMVPIWLDLASRDSMRFGPDFMHVMAMLGFLRLHADQASTAARPLAVAIQVGHSIDRLLPDDDSTTYQAACLLQKTYQYAPDEVAAEWRSVTGQDLPNWVSDANNEKLNSAVDWYRDAAQTGDIHAIRYLARHFREHGNLAEAETWYRKAAETGEVPAMTTLADILRRRNRLDESKLWWRKAAEANDTSAMSNLAMLLMIRGELAEAAAWARKAADLGVVHATGLLGLILIQQGEPKEGETWLRKAAMMGDTNAANNLLSILKVKTTTGENTLRNIAEVRWGPERLQQSRLWLPGQP